MSKRVWQLSAAVLATIGAANLTTARAVTLLDGGSRLALTNARAEPVKSTSATGLRLRPAGGGEMSAETTGDWDLSRVDAIKTTLRNPNAAPVTVRMIAANADAKDLMNACRNAIELAPGETRTFYMRLTRRPEDPGYNTFAPYYMYFKAMNVRDNTIDPTRVTKLTISVSGSDLAKGVELSPVETAGEGVPAPAAFFPFIDAYGQYTHGDWPGKIYADADFAERAKEEQRERQGQSAPPGRDEYGGWAKGPKLKATGFFYPAKHNGKWWLVDPAGRLFWSYGPTGVGYGGDITPVTGRDNWFVSLPDDKGDLAKFFKDGRGAMYKFYQDKSWRGLDIQRLNLFRKYGPDYEKKVAEVSHERLHSWGFNTMGNWSAPQIYLLHKTPYTVALNSPSRNVMKGGDGHSLQEIYDENWESGLRKEVERQRGTTAGDPWCIGFFVDNERSIGWRPRGASIGDVALRAPATQPSKLKFIERLTAKYKTIDALNAAWQTKFASWDALRDNRDALPLKFGDKKDNEPLLTDCGDFGMQYLERYWSVCRDAVKQVAPNNLFLGTRFYGHTDPAVVALASKYWDVISYNIYDNPPVGRINQYNKLDLPIMSTEWGVESDVLQTPFRDEKLTAELPADRAKKVTSYVEAALRHPNMIGAHFFQFRDQPLSGRPDGEATLRGFVNVADTPNFELVTANRRLAEKMYEMRSEAK